MTLFSTWIYRGCLLLAIAGAMTACKPVQPVFNAQFRTPGGRVELSIIGIDRSTAQNAVKVLEREFADLDREGRIRGGDSHLAQINQHLVRGESVKITPLQRTLIHLAQHFAIRSNGLINPALGKLADLWGFHAEAVEDHPPPAARAIADLLQTQPRMQDFEFNGLSLSSRHPEARLDLEAFIDGYGIDVAVARLRGLGIQNAMVKFGGNLRAIGSRDGQPWRIPIHHAGGGGILALVSVSRNEGVFTRDDHERRFFYQGKGYHDLIDPRTGYPASGTRAVTVLHDDAVTADAAAHALFVAGPADWVAVARRLGVRYVLLVDAAGALHMSPMMAKRLKILVKNPVIRLSDPL
jgi:FAD:protein FMN transferase